MIIKTAYISGALTGVEKHELDQLKQAYETMARVCKRFGIDGYVPHLHSDPDKHPHYTSREVHDMDNDEVRARDLLIVEASRPSHGAGAEAEVAAMAKKPIILCYGEGIRVSRHIRGNPAVHTEFDYKSLQDLQWKLSEWFKANLGTNKG